MKKNIIITSGPTNERIDAVMKITNMSTGALGNVVAETFLEDKYDEIGTIYYISTKMSYKPRIASDKVQFVTVESTQDLIDALQKIFATTKIDIIIHSAAVGDYAGKYTIRAEELIDEIWDTIQKAEHKEDVTKEVISQIKEMAPDVTLVGFKLLEGVRKEELFGVADRLRVKNHADYIVANDLAKIGGGKHWAMILNENGIVTECNTKKEIAKALEDILF